MVYSIQGFVMFATAQRRNQAMNAIEAERTVERWGVDTVEARQPYNSTLPSVSMQIRFASQADAQAAWTRLIASFANFPQPGSIAHLHSCTHDEDGNNCQILDSRTW